MKNYRTVEVDNEGVHFGPHTWFSHEKITGLDAKVLNIGLAPFAKGYMAWLRNDAAASEPAPLTRQDLIDIGRERFQDVYCGDNHEGALIAAIEAALDASVSSASEEGGDVQQV